MTYNGTTYLYVKNAQGDVVQIVDGNGNTVVTYIYDAWGNMLYHYGSHVDDIGKYNPFRYRGYVYDTETGLYYLTSRYYNPVWGRFINADTAAVVAASPDKANWDKNLFAYCDNNPISRKDDGGDLWGQIIFGAVIGAAFDIATQLWDNHNQGLSGKDAWFKIRWGSVLASAISGGISAIPGGNRIADAVDNFLTPVIEESINALTSEENFDWRRVGNNVIRNMTLGVAIDRLMPNVPKYIRDIKEQAKKAGCLGTRAYNKYLKKAQFTSVSISIICGGGIDFAFRISCCE